MKGVAVIAFLFLPILVQAVGSARINEIAWMGTAASASNEWIELLNSGSATVDLTGWILRIEGKKDIGLSGSVQPGSFYLIERTDDNTVPDVTADLVSSFGSGLSNSGAVLILLNQSGSEIDRVDGSDNWKIGGGDTKGNNTTKETAQLSSSSWVTASPTPRAKNSGVTDEVSTPASPENISSPTSGDVIQARNNTTQSSNTPSWPTEPQVLANAGKDKVAVVGAAVSFSGQAYGLKKEPLADARFIWNFGDGMVGEGQNVTHTYRHPGDYVVIMDVSSGYFSGEDRLLVRAEPSPLSISAITDGKNFFMELYNSSNSDIDISGWLLALSDKTFTVPPRTFVAGGKNLAFDNEVTGLPVAAGSQPELRYPNGTLAYRFGDAESSPAIPAGKIAKITVVSDKASGIPPSPVLAGPDNDAPDLNTAQAAAAPAAAAERTAGFNYLWLLGVAGISAAALGGAVWMRRLSRPTDEADKLAEEFEIIEEK